jgi:hypothetical protein
VTVGVVEHCLDAVKIAIAEKNIAGGLSDIGAQVTVIKVCVETEMSALLVGVGSVSLLLGGQVAAKAIGCRVLTVAIFHQHVGATEAQKTASTLKITVSHGYADIIKSCNAIISREESAILNKHVVAGTDVKSVVPTKHGYIFAGDILAVLNGVRPVCAVLDGISPKGNIFRKPNIDGVGASVLLLANLVKAVSAVNDRAFVSDDGNIFGVDRADDRIVPTAEGAS